MFCRPLYHKCYHRIYTQFKLTRHTGQSFLVGGRWSCGGSGNHCHISSAYISQHLLGIPNECFIQRRKALHEYLILPDQIIRPICYWVGCVCYSRRNTAYRVKHALAAKLDMVFRADLQLLLSECSTQSSEYWYWIFQGHGSHTCRCVRCASSRWRGTGGTVRRNVFLYVSRWKHIPGTICFGWSED